MISKNDADVQHLMSTIQLVWSQIGDDLICAAEEMGHYVDNEEAIECCIDADRLTMFGDQRAQDIYNSLTQKHGRSQVYNFLNKSLQIN